MRVLIPLLMIGLIAGASLAQQEPDAKDKPAQEEALDQTLKRIEDAHKKHKDFKGTFEQTKFLPLLGDELKSSGRFAFKRPDKVRWEYTKPHKSILVISGDRGKKWNESTRRVEDFKLSEDRGLDAVMQQLFTWFKGEFTKVKDDYDVEIKGREPTLLSMKPKKEVVRKYIAAIEVKFDAGDAGISSVKLIEPAKGKGPAAHTLYEFKDTKLDSGVADDEFQIKQ